MHFDSELHTVMLGEFGVLDPIRRDHFVPLPVENLQIFRRPRTGHPIGRSGARRITGATRKVNHHGYPKFFREKDRLAAHRSVLLCARLVRMQGVSVTAQGADLRPMVGKHLLKCGKGAAIVKHRQLAMRISRIISGAKFDSINAQRSELLENVRQRKLTEQRGEHSNAHGRYYLLTMPSRSHFSTVWRTYCIASKFPTIACQNR